MRGNLFRCKLFYPHEPPLHARSSPTVGIRIRSFWPFRIAFISDSSEIFAPVFIESSFDLHSTWNRLHCTLLSSLMLLIDDSCFLNRSCATFENHSI